jgi:hypothetical protein
MSFAMILKSKKQKKNQATRESLDYLNHLWYFNFSILLSEMKIKKTLDNLKKKPLTMIAPYHYGKLPHDQKERKKKIKINREIK